MPMSAKNLWMTVNCFLFAITEVCSEPFACTASEVLPCAPRSQHIRDGYSKELSTYVEKLLASQSAIDETLEAKEPSDADLDRLTSEADALIVDLRNTIKTIKPVVVPRFASQLIRILCVCIIVTSNRLQTYLRRGVCSRHRKPHRNPRSPKLSRSKPERSESGQVDNSSLRVVLCTD